MAGESKMQKWLEIVDRDIDAAEWLQKGGRWRLLEGCELDSKLSDEQKKHIDKMKPMYIAARYPEHKQRIAMTLNEQTCQDIIENTKQFKQWLLQEYSAATKHSTSSDDTSR